VRDTEAAHEVRFVYQKSLSHRVIHVDGVYGGPTPMGGLIHMAVYSERIPAPNEETYEIGPDGKMSEKPKQQSGPHGVLREVEASLILNIEFAKLLRSWLEVAIHNAEANVVKPVSSPNKNGKTK
jgi:hypothetical protein